MTETTPVTINNPQQVNIAADGGQQVYVVGDVNGSADNQGRTCT